MGLTLVTGRANTGKTGVVYDVVREAAASGRRPSLLLPTYPDVVRATAELSHGRQLGIHVEQLDRWIEDQWSLWGDGRRLVHPAQRPLVMAGAITATRLSVLARSAATPGFVRLATYVAQRAAEEPRSCVDESRMTSAADSELASLLREYRRLLDDAGLVEPGEAALVLSGCPPDCEGPVVLHRFSDLTRAQEALVVAMARSSDVWLTLPWEESFPATEAAGALVDRLRPHSRLLHCEAAEARDELARLETWLFRAPEPMPPQGSVLFCTAAGEEAEAALIAEHARRAVRRYGADRVAVVFRNASRHVEQVRVALAGAGVPADIDVLVRAGRTAYGRAVGRLLAAVSGGRKGDLLAFLRSPFARVDPAVVDALDAGWRSARSADMHALISDAARSGPGPGRALKLARLVCDRAVDGTSLRNWQYLADALLESSHDGDTIRSAPEAAEDAAAHRTLVEAAGRLAEVGAGRLTAADVLAAFNEARVAPGAAEQPGHVQVTEAHRLRSRRFDVVIVGGMTAGGFSAEGKADPGTQIADRILGAVRPSEQAQERLLFYDVCTRARRELVFIRQTADSDGSPKRPSVFWEEALDLYRRPDADAALDEEEGLLADAVRLSDLDRAAPALTPRRASLRTQAASATGDASDDRVLRARSRTRTPRGVLRDQEALGRLAARDEFSATELELYSRCPYRWFYERAVRPRTLDSLLDARTHGSLAHRALADFYTELPERTGAPRVTAATASAALGLAGEVFDRIASSSETPSAITLAEQDELLGLRRRVLDLVAADQRFLTGFAPARVELRFGTLRPEHPDPAAVAAVDLGGFCLGGSIDRIDRGDAGLVVIDYKSGEVPTGASLIAERHLQVGLYSAVATRLFETPVVAGLYRSLKSGESRGFWIGEAVDPWGLTSTDAVPDSGSVQEIVEATVMLAREAADGIRAGAIPARPASPKACDYCPAAGFCGGGC